MMPRGKETVCGYWFARYFSGQSHTARRQSERPRIATQRARFSGITQSVVGNHRKLDLEGVAGMQHGLHHRLVCERQSHDHRIEDTEIVEQSCRDGAQKKTEVW